MRKRVLLVALGVIVLVLGAYSIASADSPSPEATYVGMDTCKTCHSAIVESFTETLHPWMLQPKDKANIVGDFTSTDEDLTFTLDDVDYVIGAKGAGWKQRYIKVVDGVWRILPAQWILKTQEWKPYHADDWMERDYKQKCIGCHTTGYDTATGEFKDFGVTCEACHGPGSEHATTADKTKIVKSTEGVVCGQCHTRGKDAAGTGYPVGYNAGDETLPASWTPIAAGDKHLWPDGSSSGHHQQYIDWLQSRHSEVGITCVSCHDPHGPGAAGHQTKTSHKDACKACHSDKYDLAAHQPSMAAAFEADPEASWCVKCHMPKIAKSAVKYDIHSHTFWAPDPQKTIDATGQEKMPNACNICHSDQTAEWALTAIQTGAVPPALPVTGGERPSTTPYIVAAALLALFVLAGTTVYVRRRA